GSDARPSTIAHGGEGFNPRSRAGSDVAVAAVARLALRVSIHAPVRGATVKASILELRDLVSIHAPVRGATPQQPPTPNPGASFNPRSRAGSDPRYRRHGRRSYRFNPRSRAGSDTRGGRRDSLRGLFQSTLPCGERRRSARNVPGNES